MKKRIFQNRPDKDDRGQYTFFEDAATQYSQSNSLPPNYDKFTDKDLYTQVKEHRLNDLINTYGLVKTGNPYIRIKKLEIVNKIIQLLK